ncbi:hypothetical protein Taro_056422, partial [Colocasia esculenta]|nr:hypothetical protein [Colocasia esculenta]
MAQTASSADNEVFVGALKPLSRPESSLATSGDRGEPPLVYFWWRHFLLDCGYPVDAALTSPILPSVSRAWERHLQHSIVRVGPREHISWIESGTILRHFWSAIAEAGKAVKVAFDRVVLPPTFSEAPRENFIPPKEMPKRDAPPARKRRASREASPSRSAARGKTPDPPSPAGAGTSTYGGDELAKNILREDVAPQGDEDYNPTFDGTPSPEGADIHLVASAEPDKTRTIFLRYVPVEVAVAEGIEHPVQAALVTGETPSLQAIQDLLLSGSEMELPGFSDFAPSILKGGGWQRALHSAMAVTSAAVLPTASPLEEGEVAQGVAGDADDGAEIAAEMMETSPPGATLSSAASTLPPLEGADGASLPSDTQAVGGGLPPPPSSSEAPLEGPFLFPEHGISWPDAPQRGQARGVEGMLDFFTVSAHTVMEEGSPPSVDAVRGFLERSTVAYQLRGCPRDPWMAIVDSLWSEVRRRHQEAAHHRVQELTAEIALAEQRLEALRSRRGGAVSSRLAEREAAFLGLAEGAAIAEAELTAVERECADSQAALSALQANLADSRRGGASVALGIFCLNFTFLAFIKHLIPEFGVDAGLFGLGSTTGPGPDPGAIDYRICHLGLAYHCGFDLVDQDGLLTKKEFYNPPFFRFVAMGFDLVDLDGLLTKKEFYKRPFLEFVAIEFDLVDLD